MKLEDKVEEMSHMAKQKANLTENKRQSVRKFSEVENRGRDMIK